MTTLTPDALSGSPARHRKERIVGGIMFTAAALSIVVSGLIVYSLLSEAWTFITQVEFSRLWVDDWAPRLKGGQFSLKTIIYASFIVTFVAMAVALPVGLGAAVYLSEYAKPRSRAILKPILEILAGIPSVVLGFFALLWIAPNVVNILSDGTGGSMLAAGLGVGILTIPLVASISEDALAAVPGSLREASEGLGARKWITTVRVVIPAAISGLVAAVIIAFSRALGETMVVFLAGGAADQASFTTDPLEGGLTMTAAMASLASGTDSIAGAGLAFQSLYFVGLLLFVFTMGLNMLGNRFVRKVRETY